VRFPCDSTASFYYLLEYVILRKIVKVILIFKLR